MASVRKKKTKLPQFSAVTDKETMARIEAYRRAEIDRNLSSMIRILVKEALDARDARSVQS